MTSFYLYTNAFIYLVFSFWCLLKAEETANFSGLQFLNESGKVEYLAVYGGMELGFFAFFVLTALVKQLRFAGITFSVCLYGGLILGRCISAIVYGPLQASTFIIGSLELILGLWAMSLLFKELKQGRAQSSRR